MIACCAWVWGLTFHNEGDPNINTENPITTARIKKSHRKSVLGIEGSRFKLRAPPTPDEASTEHLGPGSRGTYIDPKNICTPYYSDSPEGISDFGKPHINSKAPSPVALPG